MDIKEKPFYILSCNGGGIRGLIVVSFLKNMEKYLKSINPEFKLYDFFDMYAGTSIGSIIISTMLTNKFEGDDLLKLFSPENCHKLIDKSIWDKMLGIAQIKPKYDGRGKTQLLDKYLDNHRFSSFDKYVIIPTYNITRKKTMIFSNKRVNDELLTKDVVNASSASPCYFPPIKINNCHNKDESISHHWFIDGGMTANNPTICAIAEAKNIILKSDIKRRLIVVNIQTGIKTVPINGEKAKDYGGINWLLEGDLIGIAMDETVVDEQAKLLLQDHCYININEELIGVNEDIDDVSYDNMNNLFNLGNKWWEMNKHQFVGFFDK